MSDYRDILKQGYLKTKSKNLGVWQKRWFILRQASSRGSNRLERYADEKTSMITYDAKVTDLTAVDRVDRMPSEGKHHVFVLSFIDGDYKQYAASSDMEANDWLSILEEHSGMSHNNNSFSHADSGRMLPEGMFHVYLLPNTITEYNGEYVMQVTSDNINIRDPNYDEQVLITWKLNTLRRYGRDGQKFTFESGRSSDTGEGLFIFTSVDCERIYQKVHKATQALVTVKTMSRRQQEGTAVVHDGSVLSFSKNMPPQPPKVQPRGDSLRSTGSSRGPLPAPRNVARDDEEEEEEDADNNANTEYLYDTAREDRQPKFTLAATGTRPDGTKFSTSYANGAVDEREYIYEEKGLSDDFRNFLSGRKADDD